MMDLRMDTAEGIFSVRAAGLLTRGGKLLVQCDGDEYALPGGTVQFGETAQEAVVREFAEETGLTVTCGRLFKTEEAFWRWGERNVQTLGFYYELSEPAGECVQTPAVLLDNARVTLEWVALEDLHSLKLYPTWLRENPCGDGGHLVYRE
ncbi:MAG: NUDIX domain-containing protein [Oscillospiraceae bacterium]